MLEEFAEKKCKPVPLWRQNLLLILTIASVFVGAAGGFALRSSHLSVRTVDLIGFPGELLMNMLKMTILPLIAASLVSGLSQLDAAMSGRIGGYALFFYAITMTSAVTTGIILVLIIHPGDPSIKQSLLRGADSNDAPANVSSLEKVLDLMRNMFPDNIVQATFQQVETEYRSIQVRTLNDSTITVLKGVHKYVYGMNVLGLIVFFIVMGLVMSTLGPKAKPLVDVFVSLDVVITAIVGIIMWYSPIGIASLVAAKILEIGDMAKTARTLAMYMLTVILGLFIQLFVTLPFILYLASRRNPFKFLKGLGHAAATAFGTASSAASLPVTFKCLEENNGVDPKFTKFVLPVGAMINMDGTALYEAVASVFIAQINGVEMTLGTVLTISITATLASIGAASIPGAGLVTMLIVLTAVGLPANDVTMILAVDWFLDRLRTMVNVLGDGVGCGFVQAMVERTASATKRSHGNYAPTATAAAASPAKIRPLSSELNEKLFTSSFYDDPADGAAGVVYELKVSPRSRDSGASSLGDSMNDRLKASNNANTLRDYRATNGSLNIRVDH